MIRINRIANLILIVLLTTAANQPAAAEPVNAGDVLPGFYLPAPAEERARNYLGLEDLSQFKITDIKADVVIIQIFSMY